MPCFIPLTTTMALLVLFLSPVLGQGVSQDAFIAEGRAFAEKNCGRCHATGLGDPSPHAMAPPFRLVVERYPSENLAEALAEGIVTGHRDMPVFVLQPHEIEAFLAYLDSFGGPRPAPRR